MSVAPRDNPIFVVVGSCGEYSDHSEWPVCWRPTHAEAAEIVALCKEQGDQATKMENESAWDELEKFKASMFDQHFSTSYTGTRYYVWRVQEAPTERPNYGPGGNGGHPWHVREAKS